MLGIAEKYFIKLLEVQVEIRPLTRDEFVNIATNGIRINLYECYVEDYIDNLIRFIEEATHDYYISNYDTEWCEISKQGNELIKVVYKEGKINFHLPKKVLETKFEKQFAGTAIKIVYMHSVAWEAINNDGKINQPIDAWPI